MDAPCCSDKCLLGKIASCPKDRKTIFLRMKGIRNRASHVGGHAIHAHADCSPMRRSIADATARRPLQTVRSTGGADDNRTAVYRNISAFADAFTSASSLNGESIKHVVPLRICAMNDISRRSGQCRYSIISSERRAARAKVRPGALVVLIIV